MIWIPVSYTHLFLENYDLILNLQVIYDVEGSETEGLFWNQNGVMLGTGAVWFGKTEDGTVKITAIDVYKRQVPCLPAS